MRKCLYFDKTIGVYEVGKWYDNVPDADYDAALADGLAHDVTEAPGCGCRLVDGRAVYVRQVRLSGDRLGHCPDHLPDALVPPPVEFPEKAARIAQAKSLLQAAQAAGLV